MISHTSIQCNAPSSNVPAGRAALRTVGGSARIPQTDGAGDAMEVDFPGSPPAGNAAAAEEESLFESWLKEPSPSPSEHRFPADIADVSSRPDRSLWRDGQSLCPEILT